MISFPSSLGPQLKTGSQGSRAEPGPEWVDVKDMGSLFVLGSLLQSSRERGPPRASTTHPTRSRTAESTEDSQTWKVRTVSVARRERDRDEARVALADPRHAGLHSLAHGRPASESDTKGKNLGVCKEHSKPRNSIGHDSWMCGPCHRVLKDLLGGKRAGEVMRQMTLSPTPSPPAGAKGRGVSPCSENSSGNPCSPHLPLPLF